MKHTIINRKKIDVIIIIVKVSMHNLHHYFVIKVIKIHLMGLLFSSTCTIREYGSTLYVGLARAVSPTNTNFWLTFLLTRLQEALYEDLAV